MLKFVFLILRYITAEELEEVRVAVERETRLRRKPETGN